MGRYVICALVGAGSMGRVYLAHDPVLERRIALKLLCSSDSALEARLLREAKAMARLPHHPDVLTVYDAGVLGTRVYIAMELVDGVTARAWLRDAHAWTETLSLFLRAGRGLAHAHASGLIHRDFKPDNILVGRDGRVHVSDFGLARSTHDGAEAAFRAECESSNMTLTHKGMLIGTPAYMAPEQLNGDSADVRSDLFGFCVTLYEALYGERPFAGRSVAELRAAVRSGKTRPIPRRSPVPRGIGKLLLQGLSALPRDRPASMNALLSALEEEARRAKRRPFAALWTTAFVVACAAASFEARDAGVTRSHDAASDVPAHGAPFDRSSGDDAEPRLRSRQGARLLIGKNGSPIFR